MPFILFLKDSYCTFLILAYVLSGLNWIKIILIFQDSVRFSIFLNHCYYRTCTAHSIQDFYKVVFVSFYEHVTDIRMFVTCTTLRLYTSECFRPNTMVENLIYWVDVIVETVLPECDPGRVICRISPVNITLNFLIFRCYVWIHSIFFFFLLKYSFE